MVERRELGRGRQELRVAAVAGLGSARMLRAGEGILPSQTFLWIPLLGMTRIPKESSRMQNGFASTLQACATHK